MKKPEEKRRLEEILDSFTHFKSTAIITASTTITYALPIGWKVIEDFVDGRGFGDSLTAYFFYTHAIGAASLGFGIGFLSDKFIKSNKREKDLARIVENSEDAIISDTPEGIITFWNKGAEVLYGYSSDEVIGKHFSFLIPKEKNSEINLLHNKIRNREQIPPFETKRLRKDGKLVDVAIKLSPIYDASGKLVGISNIARDITERLENERRINNLANIVERANLAITEVSPNGEVLYWNQSAEDIYGYLRAEIIGKNISVIVPKDKREELISIFNRIKIGEENIVHETERIRKDGKKINVSMNFTGVYDDSGNLLRISNITEDITEKKQLERKLEEAALTDPLTGLYNRRMGEISLESQMEQTNRTGIPLTVALGDMNYLKFLNDNIGHLEGDNALKYVAKTFEEARRKSDIAVRYGGDEFVLILPTTTKTAAMELERRISEKLKEYKTIDGENFPLSISFGYCQYEKGSGLTPDELIKHADSEMYIAKQKTRKTIDEHFPLNGK